MPLLRRELLQMLLAPRIEYRDYSRILPDFLTGLARESYQRRTAAIEAASASAAGVQARQQWIRKTFWKLIGGEPASRGPLAMRVTGSFERKGYRVERIVYESHPGLHIAANLYIPSTGQAPYPAVLFQLGHSLNGKASSLYQYCCQGLAQLGFVVLAFDTMGQGERTYYPAPGKNLTRFDSADTEHTVPGKQLLLTGLTSTWMQVWDAVRGVDVLASHPLVDPKRIGTTGNSGGGTLSMFLAAVEPRLACVSAACPNTDPLAVFPFNSPGASDDAEQNILDGATVGLDRWDTLYPMAPKPVQIIVSAKDAFGTYSPGYIVNGRQEFARLQRVYAAMGKPANVEWHESPVPHGLSYGVRMQIYRWMRLHLQGIATPLAAEPPTAAEADETLYASPTGNVVRDFGGLTPVKIARERAATIATPAVPVASEIRKLLRVGSVSGAMTSKGISDSRAARIEAVEIASETGVFLPAWVFRPKGNVNGRLIVLEPAGRNAQWNEDSLCQKLAAEGFEVWAPELRGLGDLRPEYGRGYPGYVWERQSEEAYAWTSLMLGRPLLGQRVTDLVAVVRAMKGSVRIAARGAIIAPALFAAELEPAIEQVLTVGGPKSYRDLLEQEEAGPTANLLFGALAVVDLPLLAKGRVTQGAAWTADAIGRLADKR